MYEAFDAIAPFWGAETTKKTGRDPLAIQNSSVVVYVNMINGITNVTSRVRYNGFFCWLLTFIAERLQQTSPSKIDNPKEQIKYIRRGELLLAYAMHYNYPQVIGVNGSIYASNNINSNTLNIAVGADIEHKPKVYWQNNMGVFGQYYIGVLTQLQLIFIPDAGHKTYRVTPKGLALCKAFRKSLTKEREDLFWESIVKGEIRKDQLSELKCIALHLIDNEDELNEYAKIFSAPERTNSIGKDIAHRIASIRLLLDYIQGEGASTQQRSFVLSFLKYNFLKSLENDLEVKDEQMSWFLYELNELSHAAYEAFHFAVAFSANEEPLPLEGILDSLEKGFQDCSKQARGNYDIYELYERLQACYRDKDFGALTFYASHLLISLYNAIEKHAAKLFQYAQLEDYDLHPGFAPALLYRLVGSVNKACDWPFAEACIFSAINDHLRSSYSKSSIGQGIVHNYMVDDGLIWLIRRTSPIRTSPRLQNVLQYLEDMKWIELKANDCYLVTERGTKMMSQK